MKSTFSVTAPPCRTMWAGTLMVLDLFQKQETFLKPLIDQFAKEGKDKKVVFEAIFSKPNAKPKWFFRKDVSHFYITYIF